MKLIHAPKITPVRVGAFLATLAAGAFLVVVVTDNTVRSGVDALFGPTPANK
jgi:hypothetical protein